MPNYTLTAQPGFYVYTWQEVALTPRSRLPVPHPSLEMRPRCYTCPVCMKRLFSVDGIDLRTDDGIDTETQNLMIEDAIMDATDLINQYCLPIYPEHELIKSRWVCRKATYLACYFLSLRRGNPAQYQSMHDSILLELEKVSRTNLSIPRLKVRHEITPGLSNIVVDDRYAQDSLRVVTTNKYGETYSGQHLDYQHGGTSGYL